MTINENFSLKHILGLKINSLRRSLEMSFNQLSEKSGLSISYLSEIEKGKKYPKGDKLMALAKALDISYDELVSTRVEAKLQPVVDLLNSEFLKEFPLESFGLEPQKVVELISANPDRINAFINSLMSIARNYEMRGEHFYFAALRSFQELNNNYFSEIEQAATEVRKRFKLSGIAITVEQLESILSSYGYQVDRTRLGTFESLRDLRAHTDFNRKVIYLNNELTSAQEAFMLSREIGFAEMNITQRPHETPPQKHYTFEAILNNYYASYFSAAFLLPEKEVVKDIRTMASSARWDDRALIGFLEKYNATPEMLMQRLTNILPKHFGLDSLFFLRFVGTDDFNEYELTKELHLSKAHNPHSNSLNEHYCRRWLSIRLIKQLRSQLKIYNENNLISGAQISKYYGTEDEYLCLTIAFPNVSNSKETISVTLGFYINAASKQKIKFIQDPDIKTRVVNTTCERCGWIDCEDRIASPTIIEKQSQAVKIQEALKELSQD